MNMFIRVVETGSFSAVAKELGSTQPTVSKNIAELESWLGAKLLNRSTRSLRLTETGADYYERCVAILQDVEDAEQNVGLLQTQPKGLVRVSAAVAFGRLHIVPRLEGFYESFPDIRIDISLNDRIVDLVEDGIDVAFRMGNLRDSNLIARKVCASPTLTVAKPEYLKKHGMPTHPRDLKDHNYIVYTDLGNFEHSTFVEDSEQLHIKVAGNLQSNNSEVLRSALLSGLGISSVPKWLVGDKVVDGSLVEVLADYQPGPTSIHVVYSPGRHLPSKFRCFMDYFADQFRDCSVINGQVGSE
ncbi:MAG: LysR family transcriptional regulator [Gammaproteobacteria bacterium]|nr:LysR family transcriptional regulator [Gammaproteobacteria bacterium]